MNADRNLKTRESRTVEPNALETGAGERKSPGTEVARGEQENSWVRTTDHSTHARLEQKISVSICVHLRYELVSARVGRKRKTPGAGPGVSLKSLVMRSAFLEELAQAADVRCVGGVEGDHRCIAGIRRSAAASRFHQTHCGLNGAGLSRTPGRALCSGVR